MLMRDSEETTHGVAAAAHDALHPALQLDGCSISPTMTSFFTLAPSSGAGGQQAMARMAAGRSGAPR
ncbi:hypothetical protein EVAR_7630_1 [Eumeta japonica]|uniref:Uncharacterized protein n=1 Tax=Eumeta variegata TaxID=151549 RepID=A0A4C1TKR7_EUMVA|nr:hypothetical protein EVAR_7630_1 [Eumeta japonica]